MNDSPLLIRLADDDDDFILALVPRFADFPLPAWRRRHECVEGIRQDLLRHLEDQPANSFLFVAENGDGERVGFIHLQRTADFFSGRSNCHISDLAVAPQHPLAGRDSVALAEVADEPFVVRTAPSMMRTQTLALCAAAGFEPELAYEAEDLPTVRGLVAAGLGVGVVPAMGLPVPTTFACPRLVPLTDDGAQREVGLAWVSGRPLLPSAEAFRRFVLAG